MPRVLIADKMSPEAENRFRANGLEVDVRPGLSPEELGGIIGGYDGLAVRSTTKVTSGILDKAGRLKVIGRAGIGVDTIDVPAATRAGIVVMNTPFGNSMTTAEHAIAMMFALARDIPQANESTHAGKWEKSKFVGVELYGKTLGVIGCGNIGSIVARRGLGLEMNVVAFDPFLSESRAAELGIRKVELTELLEKSDFITLHVPKNEKTAGMLDARAIEKMKDGVRLINCARGGLVVEADLKAALDSGKIAGAALDVFEVEPAKDNVLFGHPKVVCTPHLGASTTEAQINVAIQIAEQMSDFLLNGAVSNAVNMPSITAEEAPKLRPYMQLAEQLGSFAGQITGSAVMAVDISYQGKAARLNTRPLTACLLAALLGNLTDTVNMVNAMEVAAARGIAVTESQSEDSTSFQTAIDVRVRTEQRTRNVTGTLFAGRQPRIVNIEGVPVEAALTRDMLFIRNDDRPGLIGGLGTVLGNAGQNIADFRLGRVPEGESAVALVSLDAPVPDALMGDIQAVSGIRQAIRLRFESASEKP